jgi:hypothetical protein
VLWLPYFSSNAETTAGAEADCSENALPSLPWDHQNSCIYRNGETSVQEMNSENYTGEIFGKRSLF